MSVNTPVPDLDQRVEQEYAKRLADAIDEARAASYEREDDYADEIPFTQVVTDAFEGCGIKFLIRRKIVADFRATGETP
jgi:hypothetical protein